MIRGVGGKTEIRSLFLDYIPKMGNTPLLKSKSRK